MSKDLEVLLRTTYLGAIMMMVSRNTLKEEASNNKNTQPRRSEDRGDSGHWDKTGQSAEK